MSVDEAGSCKGCKVVVVVVVAVVAVVAVVVVGCRGSGSSRGWSVAGVVGCRR